MTTQMPPGQLTTSELAREIAALEVALRNLLAGTNAPRDGRLEALYAERAERNYLAESYLRAAQTHFHHGAS